MRFIVWVVATLLIASLTVHAADTLVVCPKDFRQALEPWHKHRKAQGHAFRWIDNLGSPDEIRKQIRKSAKSGQAKFLVLVGDADPAMGSNDAVRAVSVPTHFAPARVNIHWGKERDIATDNWYADLDDDQIPDLAVGRIPADTPDELSVIVDKILRYEDCQDYGGWRRRVSIVACPGNFGPIIDQALENGARKFATEGIPPGFETTATYGQWRSPYCPDPRRFQECALGRINEGALFWVYIGHGNCRHVDEVSLPDRSRFPILRYDDVGRLDCQSGSPIAIFLACYTGRFDDRDDSIAEEMLRTPGAPVGIIAATRVTMPYAMTVMGGELMKGYFVHRYQTLGEVFQYAKREMVLGKRDSASARFIDTVARTLNPKSPDLAAERLEHVLLFHLIGDPLLRLPRASEVTLDPPALLADGGSLTIRAHSQIAGRCRIELVPPRDRLCIPPPERNTFLGSDDFFAELTETYRKANDPVLASAELDVLPGDFEAILAMPETSFEHLHVRVFIQGQTGFAVGHAEVKQDLSAQPTSNTQR